MNVVITKSNYGSNPWFCVPEGAEPHPSNAVWLRKTEPGVIETQNGPVRHDGLARFFSRKRELVAAITLSGYLEVR